MIVLSSVNFKQSVKGIIMGFIDRYRAHLPKKKTKEEIDKHLSGVEEVGLEKGDFPAMVIAAFITFFPVLIVAMLVFYGLIWLLFVR